MLYKNCPHWQQNRPAMQAQLFFHFHRIFESLFLDMRFGSHDWDSATQYKRCHFQNIWLHSHHNHFRHWLCASCLNFQKLDAGRSFCTTDNTLLSSLNIFLFERANFFLQHHGMQIFLNPSAIAQTYKAITHANKLIFFIITPYFLIVSKALDRSRSQFLDTIPKFAEFISLDSYRTVIHVNSTAKPKASFSPVFSYIILTQLYFWIELNWKINGLGHVDNLTYWLTIMDWSMRYETRYLYKLRLEHSIY